MGKIRSTAELKDAIILLEVEQAEKEKLLREQLYGAVESLKPANLIANTFDELEKSPFLLENILGSAVGLVTGFYSNKLIFNPGGNKIKKLMGVALQFAVTNLVARNQGTIRSIGQIFFKHLTRGKRMNFKRP